VVNDIGPYLPWPGLVRIGSYLSSMPADFDSLEEVEAYLRKVLAPFGDLPDEHWIHLARHSVAWHAERERYVMLCDPQIVRAFRNPWHYSINLWKYWTAIKVPIFVLRGAKSDLLTADLAREMERRSLFARIHEIEGCGHAPPLMSADQIKLVSGFLSSQRSCA
jgi:pimeloyl-ACP methyl ester carboxylesterase